MPTPSPLPRGQALVEYAVSLALIGAGLIAVLVALRNGVGGAYQETGARLDTVAGGETGTGEQGGKGGHASGNGQGNHGNGNGGGDGSNGGTNGDDGNGNGGGNGSNGRGGGPAR